MTQDNRSVGPSVDTPSESQAHENRLGSGDTGGSEYLKINPPAIGDKLRSIRKGLDITLEQLQKRSGISKSMLSQIERAKVNPTVMTVWRLTQALDISISDLLNSTDVLPAEESPEFQFQRLSSTPIITSPDGKCRYHVLNPRRSLLPFEWYLCYIAPGGRSNADPHGRECWEHMTCVKGSLTIGLGSRRVTICEGETVRYRADVVREVRNESDAETIFTCMVVFMDQISRPKT